MLSLHLITPHTVTVLFVGFIYEQFLENIFCLSVIVVVLHFRILPLWRYAQMLLEVINKKVSYWLYHIAHCTIHKHNSLLTERENHNVD